MKLISLATAALFVPLLAGAAPQADGVSVRTRGPAVEFHASGHLGQLSRADTATADSLVAALPDGVALPAAARGPGAFERARTFRPVGGGELHRLEQRIAGIPVEGATLTVRLDGAGELRWTAGHVVDPARAVAARPALTAREAVAAANRLSSVPSANTEAARLVYLPGSEEVALAYRVDLPAQPGKVLDAPRVWIDARTGQLLRRVNRVRFLHQARVWPENPTSTPDMVTVELQHLLEGNQLKGEWVDARNCVDDHQSVALSSGGQTYNIHVCTERNKATADANDDFLFDPVLNMADPAGDLDDFAEAHAYHHVSRAYDYFRGLGLDQVGSKPLPTVVNYRFAFGNSDSATWQNALDPNGALFPYDNAFFLPAGQGLFGEDRPFDSIVFGQGTDVDFGYDGGVFYHEFTHAVVDATANLGWAVLDSYGLDGSPGAMNEGYADYFSHAITGDPVIGEYANGGTGAIRNAENDATCPSSIIGETHNDSNMWSAALWDIRGEVGDRADQAIYNALIGLPSSASFQTAAEATIAELGTLFGETEATQARAAFEGRNLLGCDNRVVPVRSGGGREFMYLQGPYMGYDPTPSYLQFRIDADDPITELYVTIGRIWSDRDYPADVKVVAKYGEEPILFKSPFGGRVTGDWDVEVSFDGTRNAVAEFETPLPAGPIHFALINRGMTEAMIGDFEIEWMETPENPGTGGTGGTPGTGGSGGSGGSDAQEEDRGGGADSSGCSQAGGAPALAGLLFAAALFLRRRRS